MMNDNVELKSTLKNTYLTISSKNQITLNKDIRSILNVEPGDKVYFDINSNKDLIMKKLMTSNKCPICEGTGEFDNSKCLFCDGYKFFRETVDNKFIIQKLSTILINNDLNLNISKDNNFQYKIEHPINSVIENLSNAAQLAIIINTFKKYTDSSELIDINLIKKSKKYFSLDSYKENIIKLANKLQLDILKTNILSGKQYDNDDKDIILDSFLPEYRQQISILIDSFDC